MTLFHNKIFLVARCSRKMPANAKEGVHNEALQTGCQQIFPSSLQHFRSQFLEVSAICSGYR